MVFWGKGVCWGVYLLQKGEPKTIKKIKIINLHFNTVVTGVSVK